MRKKLSLGEKCVLRDAIVAGVIGILAGLLPIWVHASVGERVYLCFLVWICAFVALADSDPTLRKLEEIRDRRNTKEKMRPRRVKEE